MSGGHPNVKSTMIGAFENIDQSFRSEMFLGAAVVQPMDPSVSDCFSGDQPRGVLLAMIRRKEDLFLIYNTASNYRSDDIGHTVLIKAAMTSHVMFCSFLWKGAGLCLHEATLHLTLRLIRTNSFCDSLKQGYYPLWCFYFAAIGRVSIMSSLMMSTFDFSVIYSQFSSLKSRTEKFLGRFQACSSCYTMWG